MVMLVMQASCMPALQFSVYNAHMHIPGGCVNCLEVSYNTGNTGVTQSAQVWYNTGNNELSRVRMQSRVNQALCTHPLICSSV